MAYKIKKKHIKKYHPNIKEEIYNTYLVSVPIDQVDIDNFTYSVWAWSDYSAIKDSIEACGFLFPPILVQKDTDNFVVVAGQKRIRAAKDIGYHKILAKVIPHPKDSFQLFIHTVLENLSFRNYNLVEKSMILDRLDSYRTCGYPIEKILHKLVVTRVNYKYIKRISILRESQKEAIACGKVADSVALRFPDIQEEDQLVFINILERVDFGQNRQREVFEWLLELKSTNNLSFNNILNKSRIRSILEMRKWNPKQKGFHICRELRKMRFPVISGMELEFASLKGKIKFPKNIKILNEHPFEDDAAKIEIIGKNKSEIMEACRWLVKNGESRDWNRLIGLSLGKAEPIKTDSEETRSPE